MRASKLIEEIAQQMRYFDGDPVVVIGHSMMLPITDVRNDERPIPHSSPKRGKEQKKQNVIVIYPEM